MRGRSDSSWECAWYVFWKVGIIMSSKVKRAFALLLGIALVSSQPGAPAFAASGGGSDPDESAVPAGVTAPAGAEGQGVYYYDENGEKQPCFDAAVVDGGPSWGSDGTTTWYVVPEGGVTVEDRIKVSGNVRLILTDGAELAAKKGIEVSKGDSLTIYGQREGSGKLTADGGSNDAGIGGSYGYGIGVTCGTVTVNGGSVHAESFFGAGIGGGDDEVYGGGGGTVTVNGGSVHAESAYGAGIGGGDGDGGDVSINGGSVTATSVYGAGIGGGCRLNSGTIGGPGTFSASEPGNAFIVASGVDKDHYIQDMGKKDNWSGVIFLGVSGAVYGSPTLMQDAEIPEGCELVVESGETLTVGEGTALAVGGTVENHGTIDNHGSIVRSDGSAFGSINNGGSVNDYGSIEDGLVNGGTVNVSSQVRLSFSVAGSSDPVTSASFGQTVTATAAVKDKDGKSAGSYGTVEFYLNGEDSDKLLDSAAVADGSAKLEILLTADDGFAPGENKVIARFNGSAGLIPSKAEAELLVGLGTQPADRIEMDKTELVYGDAAPLVTPVLLLDGAVVNYSIVENDTGADVESDVASINGDRRITVNKAGSFCVKADIEKTDEYAAKTVYSALVTVEKRKASVRPADASIVQGEALPAFSLAYEGLVEGESIVPDVEPALSCEADGTKPGEFAITWDNVDAVPFEGAENYEVSKEARGTLRVAEPAGRETSGAGGEGDQGPKALTRTGDPSAAAPWALLALASAAALGALAARRRRRMER